MRRVLVLSNAVLARLAAVGADPRDDEQTRQAKVLLVLTSVLILPIAVVWGSLYLIFGSPVGYVPFLYALILLGAIIAFARTRNFALLLYVSVVDILLAPTLSMVPLGGFLPSGGVGLWGILAPVGALVFSGPRAGLRWFFAYLAVFISSGVAGQIAGPVSTLPGMVHEHDARPQRRRGGLDRLHPDRDVPRPARPRDGRAGPRAGTLGAAPSERAAQGDRASAQGR